MDSCAAANTTLVFTFESDDWKLPYLPSAKQTSHPIKTKEIGPVVSALLPVKAKPINIVGGEQASLLKLPDSIKNIAIYNASHVTTELPGSLLLALRSIYPYPERINIISNSPIRDANDVSDQEFLCQQETTLYIMICPAGFGSSKHIKGPKYYITYQLDPKTIFDNEPYRMFLSEAIYNWDYSKINIEHCTKMLGESSDSPNKNFYDLRLRYVPPGYTDTLSVPDIVNGTYLYSDEGKDIDVLFLGWDVYPRRKFIKDELYKTGLRIWFVCTLDIEGMKKAVRRARICINIHHTDDMPVFQSVRMNVLLSNQACVVSENISDPELDIYQDNIVVVPYDKLVSTCEELIKDPVRRRDIAVKSYQWYRNERAWNKIVDFPSLLPISI